MQKTRKILITTILLTLILGAFFGCGKSPEEGEIKKIDIESSVIQNEGGVEEDNTSDDTDVFTNTKTSLKYKFAKEHIGRADISIPYPETWEVKKNSDYNICFRAPYDDPYFPGETIWFHSTLAMDANLVDSLNPEKNHQIVRQYFEGKIQKDPFYVKGKKYKMLPSSDIEKVIADDVTKPEYQYELTYRDWDAVTTPSSNGLYHHDLTFYWRKIPCILSGMTSKENADKLDELILYMMTNSEYVTDRIVSIEKYSVFDGDTTEKVKMCPMFEHTTAGLNDLNGTFTNVSSFMCPMDSGTGYSQTSICFYKIKKNKWPKKITEKFFFDYCEEPFFSNSIGSQNYQNAEIYGRLDESTYESNYGGAVAKEYLYSFDINNLRSEGFYEQQHWLMLIHTFNKGDYTYIVVTTHPEDSAKYAMEAYSIAAATFSFK